MGRSRTQHRALKMGMVLMGLCLAAYIVGRPLYYHLSDVLTAARRHVSSSSYHHCPPCHCDCFSHPLLSLSDGLSNHSFTDCMKRDPEVSEEMEKSFTDLLSEEVKLREAKALENQQHADMALLEAKKMASQYQKDAESAVQGWKPVRRQGRRPKQHWKHRRNFLPCGRSGLVKEDGKSVLLSSVLKFERYH